MNSPNPILDFGIDKAKLQYIGQDLQRPECILAERDGTLWSADARGGVMKILPDGTQKIALLRRLHALRNDLQSQLVRQDHHGLAKRLIVAVESNVVHERPIDFQVIDIESLQISQ